MRIWFDTEFLEDGRTIDLISIGLVREDGAELYLENSECELSAANDWVREHVLPKLWGQRATRAEIRDAILALAGPDPEFWAYYADYDWVALCQLFGRMIDLPKGWPMYCRDLKQLVVEQYNNVRLPKQDPATEHHALNDARWARDAHVWLLAYGARVVEAMPRSGGRMYTFENDQGNDAGARIRLTEAGDLELTVEPRYAVRSTLTPDDVARLLGDLAELSPQIYRRLKNG